MAAPYEATIVQLSSGQLKFNDPTKPWTPDNFPNLPSTSVSLTSRGRIEDATIQTIRLTNAVTYESYEPVSTYSDLQKSFLIAENGDVSFEEAKMGFVSTVSASFDADIREFGQSNIGGTSIHDVLSGTPDTVTNAIAKLDGWITNAFLLQPPAVQIAQVENTSIFAGLRWTNFNTYSVFDKFIPYVASIGILIGDPNTPDYLTLEVKNCIYFPYKTYRDGISPEGAPLVRLRLFSDDYAMSGTIVSKKSTLDSCGIHIISESGNMTLPPLGPVVSIENTDGIHTYTTLSIYLPNMPLSYPLDTPIPIRIFYLNRTEGPVNVVTTAAIHTSVGAPDAPQNLTPGTQYENAIQFDIHRPIYSDAIAGLTDPFFSSYTSHYTFSQLATAHSSNLGFQYGSSSPTSVPYTYSTYTTTFEKSDPYINSTQTISIKTPYILPGIVWSTTVQSYNITLHGGPEGTGPYLSTLFPSSNMALCISSVSLLATDPFVAPANTLNTPIYTPFGWSTGALVDHPVVFISSPTYLTTQLSTFVQFNDPSYPGDRSTMIVQTYFTNTNFITSLSDTLALSTFNDRFLLDTPIASAQIATEINDTYSTFGYTDYFYKAMHTCSNLISNIPEPNIQNVKLTFTNTINTGYNDPLLPQTYSTPIFEFETTSSLSYATTNILYKNKISGSNPIPISGLYTPTPSSLLHIDMLGSNFAYNYANSNFLYIGVYLSSLTEVSPLTYITSNQFIYDTVLNTEITTLPFPEDRLLTFSSIQVPVNNWIYTDPIYNTPIRIVGGITSANPEHTSYSFESSFSTLYVDTVSINSISRFSNSYGIQGQRVLSLLPRLESPGTPTNMDDGISSTGDYGPGLNVSVSSFLFMSTANQFAISSAVVYNHASTLLTTTYTDPYNRELLYTYGRYIHPAGYNFSPFSGVSLGVPSAIYPDFTYDMYYDENKGNRFASFFIEQPAFSEAIPLQYMMIAIHNPSFISTITTTRANNFFPNFPVQTFLVSSMRVHMHAKVFGNYDVGGIQTVETAWLNCFKQVDELTFDDSIYDIGACSAVYVPSDGSNAGYMYTYVQMDRRFFTKIGVLIRVGISYDGSIYSGDPITFDGVSVSFSD